MTSPYCSGITLSRQHTTWWARWSWSLLWSKASSSSLRSSFASASYPSTPVSLWQPEQLFIDTDIHCELLPGTLLKSLLELYQGFFGPWSLKPLENGKESEPFWPVFHLVPFHWQCWKSGLPRFQLVTGFLEDLVAQMPFSVSEWSLCSSQRSQLSAKCGWKPARQ